MSALSRYLPLFATEAAEHLSAMGAELVRVEGAARQGGAVSASVEELFRHAHSLKGMAASLELAGIATLAHRAEDLLADCRRGRAALDVAHVDLLLAAVDALVHMVEAARTGAPADAPPELIDRLAAARGAAVALETPTAPATAHERGGDASAGASDAVPVRAEAAPPAPARPLRVEVTVSAAAAAPALRAFVVVSRLARLGVVVRCAPALDELRAGRLPRRRLDVALDAHVAPAEVVEALRRIPELDRFDVADEAPGAPLVAREAPVAAPWAAGDRRAQGRTVRVAVEQLDAFLDGMGELIQATARLRELGRGVPDEHRSGLDEGIDRLQATVRDLHDRAMAVRMTPLAGITDRLPRAARDLARATGKQVELEVRGAEIQIDRAILDELSEPLLHVLRNAVDHGIEAPEVRAAAGKEATGRIVITARRERDRVLLDVADDGRGMDPDRLRSAAVAAGAVSAGDAGALSEREALHLACLPGVSTARALTEVSGRGVGMDAVKRTVEALGGGVDVESTPGAGTRWSLRLPLTRVVQPVLLVQVGAEVLALPIARVHGAAQVDLASLERRDGVALLPWAERRVPVLDLRDLLGFAGPPRSAPHSVVVAEGDGAQVALVVDALLGQQEVVLKPLSRPLDEVAGLSAVTVLASGRPVFVLDVPRMLVA